jgi:hypothetical protein
MSPFKPPNARLGRIGLAFAALISIATVATPASADEESFEQRYHKRYLNEYPNYRQNNYRHHHRRRHNDNDGLWPSRRRNASRGEASRSPAPPPASLRFARARRRCEAHGANLSRGCRRRRRGHGAGRARFSRVEFG